MEKSVGEASRNVSKLIEAAEGGENVIITRRGKPVFKIVRIQQTSVGPLVFFVARCAKSIRTGSPMSDEEADALLKAGGSGATIKPFR
ncbi:MAG: type II toxin-antitoxin system Phd/YefM family antitoxin [Bryobacteraceae bacterium]